MESWLREFFDWLPMGWPYYSLIGLIAFLESLALIGIFIPGSVIIVFAGFLAAHGQGEFTLLASVCILGSVAGDLLSYFLGARMGSALLARPLFKKRLALLHEAQLFFAAHGGKSVFLGRFVGFLRPFIPFVAGSAHMPPLAFSFYALVSGILWGIAYPGLGHVFAASWQMVEVWTGRFSLLILALLLLLALNALFWKYLVPRCGRACARIWQELCRGWERLCRSRPLSACQARFPGLWAFLADRFSRKHGTGLYLTTGLAVSALFAAFLLIVIRDILFPAQLVQLDQRVYDLVQVFRHPATDAFFLTVTYLGSAPVILMLGGLAFLWLILFNRDFSATILVAGTLGGETLVFLLKSLFDRPRPQTFFPHLTTTAASFPSAHAFVALVFYGLLVYMLLGNLKNLQSRFILVLSGSFLALLIGSSRVYLGVHWLSDVVGGFLLAALWLTFLITACETRRQYGGEFPWRKGSDPVHLKRSTQILLLGLAAGVALWGLVSYIGSHLPKDLESQAPAMSWQELPATESPETLLAPLPLTTESFTGERRRPLSLVVFATEDHLFATLRQAGWQEAEPLALTSFLRSTLDLLSRTQNPTAPVLPRFVVGKPQDISFVKGVPAGMHPARRVTLAWRLGYRLPDGRSAWGIVASFHPDVKRLFGVPLPLPVIAPEVDRERDALVAELQGTGRVRQLSYLQRLPPGSGRDLTGSPFTSDGRTALLWIR